jgi:hypothetical protein
MFPLCINLSPSSHPFLRERLSPDLVLGAVKAVPWRRNLQFHGARSFIKLKKDHIAGLGDTADFTIVGGRRDARDEQEFGIGKLWWTSFYIRCLENKDEVCRFNAKLRFRIIDVADRHNISKENMLFLNRHGYFERVPFDKSITEFNVRFEYGRQLHASAITNGYSIPDLSDTSVDYSLYED